MKIKDLEGYELVNGRYVKKKKYNKYRNTKKTIDDIVFDSEKEAKYYKQLMLLKKAKEITEF